MAEETSSSGSSLASWASTEAPTASPSTAASATPGPATTPGPAVGSDTASTPFDGVSAQPVASPAVDDIPDSSTVDSSVASDEAASAQVTGQRVIVIESDVPTADMMVNVLESAGYQVEVATDGTYGLMLIDSFNPELILLGAGSQRLNPHEVTQSLRHAPQYAARFRATPIIYIADNKQLIQQRFHSLPDTPLSEYIFKPINGAELLDKVGRVFATRQEQQ